LQIEWPQVDLNTRLIRLEPEQTKTDEARILPLSSALVNMLAEMEPKTGRVFDGTNLRKEWKEWVKACAAAGLGRIIEVPGKKYDPRYEGLTLHDLRRSAIRDFIRTGTRASSNVNQRSQDALSVRPIQHRQRRGCLESNARERVCQSGDFEACAGGGGMNRKAKCEANRTSCTT
jgi:integrase